MAAVFSIGTELTRGELINSNAAWLGDRLVELGFDVVEHCTVDDDEGRIASALERLCAANEVVVCTGGLGPTSDDLTAATVARTMGVSLRRDDSIVDSIREKFRAFGREMPEANAKQGDFPEGASILPNPIGTAPGFSVRIGRALAFFMPGVPREMEKMFAERVAPLIESLAPRTTYQTHIKTFGMTESGVAEAIADLEDKAGGIVIGYRASFPEIEVKILAQASTRLEAEKRSAAVAEKVRARLGDAVFGGRDDHFENKVVDGLREQGIRIAVAESCTGGMIGELITSIPGSSDVLLLSAVTYSNEAKKNLLGVTDAILDEHGAVSEACARAMAEGVLRLTNADRAVAVTGIAGPGGGSADKPVGTVWFSVAYKNAPTVSKLRRFPGDRERVRRFAAYFALELLSQVPQNVT
ncbi:MAG: competence/damage-inducible protein A [Polyangiales bacterium]